ncbi:MAG: multidrug efflux SMR transporter [Kiritimatiellae bacterium]|nr:multidrug efflux SMR transporter [Kiritimatiellia bacterium]
MNWVILLVAGFMEVVWAAALKYSCGFTRILPAIIALGVSTASVGMLAIAVRTIPLGAAYAVWTGFGAVGGVLAGAFLFGEPLSAMRLACASLIVVGIVGLKIA